MPFKECLSYKCLGKLVLEGPNWKFKAGDFQKGEQVEVQVFEDVWVLDSTGNIPMVRSTLFF